MKRIALLLGLMFVGIIALLEADKYGKNKKTLNLIPDSEYEYDEAWWDS